jgi:NMD protein affecting ribosome stability and mRNA decay
MLFEMGVHVVRDGCPCCSRWVSMLFEMGVHVVRDGCPCCSRWMSMLFESTAEAGSKGANLNIRKEFHDQRVFDAQQEIETHGADTAAEITVHTLTKKKQG